MVHGVARHNFGTNNAEPRQATKMVWMMLWIGFRSERVLTVLELHTLELGTANNLGAAW